MRTLPTIAVLVAVSACATVPPQASPHTLPVSREGLSHLAAAKLAYAEAHGKAGSPGEHLASLAAAHRALELAIATDPRCLLFHTKAAELCLELALGHDDGAARREWSERASAHLRPELGGTNRSADLYVTFWLTRARLEVSRGDFERADLELENARVSLAALAAGTPRAEGGSGGLIVALYDLVVGLATPHEAVPEAALPETQRLQLLTSMLWEGEEWRPDSGSLLAPARGTARARPTGATLERRLRARLRLLEIERDLACARELPTEQVMTRLREVLDLDGSCFAARRALACCLAAHGRPKQALAQLVRITRPEPGDQALANRPSEQLLVVGIHLKRWLAEKSDEALTEAAAFAESLAARGVEVRADDPALALPRAALLFFRGRKALEPTKLRIAERLLERGTHPDDAELARELLADVRTTLTRLAQGGPK